MKYLLALLLPLLPLQAFEEGDLPDDQVLVIFGASGYVLFKVLDFANDHGYRYVKILKYEFNAFEHNVTGICNSEQMGGRFFELTDENTSVSFLCFEQPPNDRYIIDLEKYRSLLEDIQGDED